MLNRCEDVAYSRMWGKMVRDGSCQVTSMSWVLRVP